MTVQKQKATTGLSAAKPRLLLILALSVLLCGEGYFGFRLHTLSNQQEQLKEDYSTLNNITFGIFSVAQWRDKIADIVNRQIRDFSMTPQQKKDLQKEVEQILHALINKAVAMINKPQKSVGGKLKKLAFNALVNTDKIQAEVPAFAKTIIDKVNNPASKKRLSDIASSKLNQLEHQTFDSTENVNAAVTNHMFRKYHVTSADEFNNKLNSELSDIRVTTYEYSFAMIGCVLVVLAVWWLLRTKVELHATLFILSLLFAFILLFVGLTASMIEVDARIKTLNFVLLGENVVFKNQVLFFQSKSILDVVVVLVKQPKLDAILVGILILVFSILFPCLKLISTGIHLLSKRKIAENKVIKYFAFQSGKWSMADVMVIGILMTYIGLNGILESQLSNLNIHSKVLTTITTNNTALQPGYIIFVSFVLYGLVLSTILKYITPYDAT
ncbi:MAG: paraquat-inducible protein A [Mucilaginibacter sp.]